MIDSYKLYKINFFSNRLFGLLLYIIPIILIILLFNKTNDINILFFGLLIYFTFLLFGIMILHNETNFRIVNSLSFFKRSKTVYHDELGYFTTYIKEDKYDANCIYIYEEKFIFLKYIGESCFYDITDVKNKIKNILDDEFKIKLSNIKKKEDYKSYHDWDGSLTKKGSRKNKINKIVK